MRKFTAEELRQFDGQNGNPAYIGYKGKVYDLSASDVWEEGLHMALHEAGTDLTVEIDFAPHEESFVLRFPVVGDLT